MALTAEQAESIKEQIKEQLRNFPEDKRKEAEEYINSLNDQQLEEFVMKNNLVKLDGQEEFSSPTNQPNTKGQDSCIMCLLSSKKIESFIIYEDKDYICLLEINPFSKAHSILIPKEHISKVKDIKSKAYTLANTIGKHITKKMSAENFQVNSSDELGHAILNIIPTYKNEKIDFKRRKATKEELQDLYSKIGKIEKKEKVIKIKTEKSEQIESSKEKSENKAEKPKSSLPQFSRRIP